MSTDNNDKVTSLQKEYRELKVIIDSCCRSAEKLSSITKSLSLIRNASGSFAKHSSSYGGGASRGSSGLNGRYMNDLIGGLFGALSRSIFGSSKIAGMRAGGGGVAAGVPYVVGERGAEVFVPQSSGYIVPNHHASNRPINLVMNVTTPDVDSFRKSQTQILSHAARALQKASRY